MSWTGAPETWDDAAAYTPFTLSSGRPVGISGLRSSRSDQTPGMLSTGGGEVGYSSIPLGEAAWQAGGLPYTQGWSARIGGWVNEDLAQQGEMFSQLYDDFVNKTGQFAPGAATTAGGTSSDTTSAGSGGAGWEVQNQWNQSYDNASSTSGVPANLIKAVQAKETGRADYTGQTNCEVRPKDGCLALNTGIFAATAESYGLDFQKIVNDPDYAIMAMGTVLNGIAQQDASTWGGPQGQTTLEYAGWEGVAGVYFGGTLVENFVDENGETSDNYVSDITMYLDQLGGLGVGAEAGAAVNTPNGNKTASNYTMIWGGTDAPITQEMGSMEGATYNNDPHIYDYAEEYGFHGHPGLDIGLPSGTPLTAPIQGTVIGVGQQYLGGDGAVLTAPERYYPEGTGGVGEIRIQAPNGDIIILGHVKTSAVQLGQAIDVGTLLGTSGQSDNRAESGHLHLEVRTLQPDGGYHIADPRTYFGGQPGIIGGGGEPAPEAVTPVGVGGGSGRGYEQPPML